MDDFVNEMERGKKAVKPGSGREQEVYPGISRGRPRRRLQK